MNKTLRIMGIRGVPAAHGGFETFAEHLALYLVKRGWRVIVYCQEQGTSDMSRDVWRAVERIRIPVESSGPSGTVVFDWKATLDAARSKELVLTLGYDTGMFCALLRLRGIKNVINMDGIEWKRQKWGKAVKAWYWINDWAASWLGDHLVADHPEIQRYLERKVAASKITMIPYGADRVAEADTTPLDKYGLMPGGYAIVIARPEPENSILEIVRAWSRRARGYKLVVLGKYDRTHAFQRQVMDAASDEVRFIGAVYDKPVVQALRFHALFYVHGHQVGGTNPSLVESLGAGNAVLAHDNPYNRWVAGDGGIYFSDEASCALHIDELLGAVSAGDGGLLATMRAEALKRFECEFTWQIVLEKYEKLLERWLPA